MRFGAAFWVQRTSWPAVRSAVLTAERAGWDGVWIDDHLLSDEGDWRAPKLEGWATLAAIAAATTRVRLGHLVSANTFRNPGLTAKLATTLDHVSDGRAVLGIGGAWFEREHDAFGFETWGSGFGERLDRLDEAVGLIRRLLDGETVSHAGRFYTFHDALCEPRPIQPRLPILIGGSGPRKTLRTVARYADLWNTGGTVDEVAARLALLRVHCADVGRTFEDIGLTTSFQLVIRDDPAEAERVYAAQLAANGTTTGGVAPTLLGPPRAIADAVRPYRDLGFGTMIVRMPAPFDHQTLERVGEVGALLDG
jgi:alkanesulfonate monooxygenase SsuD/methylene tetrahydromethanopterin reductase-like flavin-dependent oxidoreductase (luciferase family)